jgi:shikimate dehydrogenase
VEFVLRKIGIQFKRVSRKTSVNTITYDQLTTDLVKENTLIINTTPVGMYPNSHETPRLPYEVITPDHFLFDLIYNPPKTTFLKKGEERGATIQNGYDMLVYQAEESWRIWNSEMIN